MAELNFKVSPADARLILQITARAARMFAATGGRAVNRLALDMDITATHANGCPLKLAELLAADDFNFAHDVGGITRHIDRSTGRLRDCFVPRFAAPQPPRPATEPALEYKPGPGGHLRIGDLRVG